MRNGFMTARKRVMIISHGRSVGLELADRLASDGYEVALAQQADEAIEQLDAMQPDGIVLDRHLPIARGLEALRRIRLQCPQVPIFTIREPKENPACLPGAAPSSLRLTPLQGSVMGALLDARIRVVRT